MVPRPASMLAKPQVALPETLINESVPVVPVVMTRPLASASYATVTPETVLPEVDASWFMPFSSAKIKLSRV